MLPHSWYHILNTNDPVEHHVPCYAFLFFHDSHDDDSYGEFQDISSAEKGAIRFSGVIPVHWYHNGSSIIRFDEKFEYLWLNEAKNNGAGDNAFAEIKNFYDRPMSCFTDYERYFMCLQCNHLGKRYIWIHSRNPHPSAQDILRARNKLVEIGDGWSSVPLHLSDCRNFDEPEKFSY
ncbi:uncharacterized protein LOC120345727 [Styela clava]